MIRLLLLSLLVLLLAGCAAERAGEPANPAGAGSIARPDAAAPLASFDSSPIAAPVLPEKFTADQVASVQVEMASPDEDAREALRGDDESDRLAIGRLVRWIGEAEREAAGDSPASDDSPPLRTRAVIHLNSGEAYAIEPVCEAPSKESGAGECRDPEGDVTVALATGSDLGSNAPASTSALRLHSPDLASWLETGFRYDTTAVIGRIAPRAVGDNGAEGELQLMPESNERYKQFDAISCTNDLDSYRITGDYDVVYRSHGEDVQLVDSLRDFTIVRPDLTAIRMERLDFGSFAAFLLYPDDKDCHGLEFHLYGVKDGQAFPFAFEWEGNRSDTFSTDPLADSPKPRVLDGRLVVDGGYAAGMDHRTRYTFEPDASVRTMKLMKEESLPVL